MVHHTKRKCSTEFKQHHSGVKNLYLCCFQKHSKPCSFKVLPKLCEKMSSLSISSNRQCKHTPHCEPTVDRVQGKPPHLSLTLHHTVHTSSLFFSLKDNSGSNRRIHFIKVLAPYTKMTNILTCVPTGIKTGVSTSECNNLITLDLAFDTEHFAFIWKLSAVLFPIAGIFKYTASAT